MNDIGLRLWLIVDIKLVMTRKVGLECLASFPADGDDKLSTAAFTTAIQSGESISQKLGNEKKEGLQWQPNHLMLNSIVLTFLLDQRSFA